MSGQGPIPIRSITARLCKLVNKNPGTYTGGIQDPEDDYFLFVGISDGRESGYGECNPTSILYPPGHIGRSSVDEWQTCLDLCRELLGKDARFLGRLIPEKSRFEDNNSVIDAVDFALHDLVGRRIGMPVAVLLGGLARPFVWGMPVVYTDTPDNMAKRAGELYRQYGFRYYKLKPIGNLEADAETLRKMSEKTSAEVRYYMDSNYMLAMNPDEVIGYINELFKLGLVAYEDPINTDFETYRYIQSRVKAKIMLDEKARSLNKVLEIVQAKAAGQINIHANWAGGFQPALQKANLAALAGMPAMIGSTYYLGPGAAAYQTLAAVLPLAAPCEQVNMDVFGFRSFIEDPYETREGKIFIRDAPGLGIQPKIELIEEITTKKEIIA